MGLAGASAVGPGKKASSLIAEPSFLLSPQKSTLTHSLTHSKGGPQRLKKCCAPNVGLEPTTLRLRVSCSTD